MTLKVEEKLVRAQLLEAGADGLSRRTGFVKRAKRTLLTPYGFVLGFFLMFSKGENDLETWANNIYKVTGNPVSKQALDAKFYERHINFIRSLLNRLMAKRVLGVFKGHQGLFKFFDRVLLEDSTCIALHRQLFDHFKGSHSKTGQAATLRLQTLYDIKAEDIDSVEVQSYRDNDQKHSSNILDKAKPGDLVLRDLGYFVLGVLAQMAKAGIYFVSRIRLDVCVFDARTGKELNLLKALRSAGQTLDKKVLTGKKLKVPLRLVAVKLPEPVAEQKREKAKKDRNKKTKHSKRYMELLGWTVLVTNIPVNTWSVQQLVMAYTLRWRIEILFKAWKSCLKLDKILAVQMKQGRFLITLYLSLLYIVMFCQPTYKAIVLEEKSREGEKQISIMRFYKWLTNNFERLIQLTKIDDFIEVFLEEIHRYCAYSKQKTRDNHLERLYCNFLN